ncbi:glycosyltransferase family 25 protein [Phyllobacterium sp. 0TCS1.6C]|uniref:glycosyltransferase family 25 protein n=1 Tax=unclassified Phyllobacterium TaxID=2638441 RepID=UPI0022640725|nr:MULTISPECIES: glycosyltransferase family 25 protein [unclassified Phyllobacterium]MCX8281367.1 glycosyltransferase family 25 protein [Phyllobacterium sp. 0TCS1.6C]MCX8295977.1 glycosyltransferase family 25 protein [Phyllobacterium sp. 0TCS1.6A]
MSVPVYVINLERSHKRWETIRGSAEKFDIDIRRIEAVDGGAYVPGVAELDERAFFRQHGRSVLPGEIGCYLSHVAALNAIAAGEEPHAVIVEDDVEFKPGFLPFVERLSRLGGWDAVKLVNHRTAAFRTFATIDGVHVGRCLHGPLGSAAAYMVTREGAARLARALLPMSLPYDVALERGWAGRFSLFATRERVVGLSPEAPTTIGSRKRYSSTKPAAWKRSGALLFRTGDYIRRVLYGLQTVRLKELKE